MRDYLIKIEFSNSIDTNDKKMIFSLQMRNQPSEYSAYKSVLDMFKGATLEQLDGSKLKISNVEIEEIAPLLRFDLPQMYKNGFVQIMNKIKQEGTQFITPYGEKGYKCEVNGTNYIVLSNSLEKECDINKGRYSIIFGDRKVQLDYEDKNNYSIGFKDYKGLNRYWDNPIALYEYVNSQKEGIYGLVRYEDDDSDPGDINLGDLEIEKAMFRDSEVLKFVQDFSEFIGIKHLRMLQDKKQASYEKEFDSNKLKRRVLSEREIDE